MQKKQQPQKGQAGKNKIQTVNQQNEPFLRALQKKIRNLNKKLVEIADLEGKPNLKPEQLEKIARKAAVQEEIAKIEENATFFKEVYAENVVHYRNQQLKELDTLARALALYHAGTTHDHPRLQALWRAIELADHQGTLNQATDTIAQALRDFANDYKLQKNLAKHHEIHGESALKSEHQTQKQQEEQIVNTILDEKVVKKEEPEADLVVGEPVVEKKPEPEVPVVVEPVARVEEEVKEIPQEKPKEEAPQTEKPQEKRERPYREKDNNKRSKPQYKPKYEEKEVEKKVEKEERDESVSSSEQEEERARQFRKDEIHKLEEEGFIMVGKPKPKPKDSTEQQKYHDRVHGKKLHHHHHAKNT